MSYMKGKHIKAILSIVSVLLILVIVALKSEDISQHRLKANLRIALLLSENLLTYDVDNHRVAINELSKSHKIDSNRILIKENVTENDCFNTVEEIVNDGYNLIFAVGNDIEDYIVQSATEHPKIQYCIAYSKQAITSGMDNLHSFSLVESESKYLAGIVAGMKIKDLLDNGVITTEKTVLGYIGTNENSENISAYTAFYLGAKSVVSDVTMKVKFINSENDIEAEKQTAKALIANGCILLAQHSDSNVIAEICEQNSIYCVCNNEPPKDDSYFALTSTIENWDSCYSYAVNCIVNSEELPTSWCKSIDTSSVDITEINKNVFVFEKNYNQANDLIAESKEKLKAKTLHIFDTTNWKVNGETIASTMTEELKDDYGGIEYIDKGRFMEYELTTLPKFAFKIDGIEILT